MLLEHSILQQSVWFKFEQRSSDAFMNTFQFLSLHSGSMPKSPCKMLFLSQYSRLGQNTYVIYNEYNVLNMSHYDHDTKLYWQPVLTRKRYRKKHRSQDLPNKPLRISGYFQLAELMPPDRSFWLRHWHQPLDHPYAATFFFLSFLGTSWRLDSWHRACYHVVKFRFWK